MTPFHKNGNLRFMTPQDTSHHLSMWKRRAVDAGVLLYKLYVSTWRLTVLNPWWENPNIDPDRPILFSTWHEDDFTLIGPNRNRGYFAIVSLSKDGEMMNRALLRLKYRTCRGSSSRGGVRAMLSIIRAMRSTGYHGVLTVDGPRGPRHIAKPGIAAIAYKTGAQIVTLSGGGSPRHVLTKTWSQAYFPLPFARVIHVFSETPIQPPADNSEASLERARKQIENQLINDHRQINSMLNRTGSATGETER